MAGSPSAVLANKQEEELWAGSTDAQRVELRTNDGVMKVDQLMMSVIIPLVETMAGEGPVVPKTAKK